MEIIIILLALFFAGCCLLRLRHPGDLRLNRAFVGHYVQDSRGKGPSRLRIERLGANQTTDDAVQERVFYRLQATFADGTERPLLAQIFYPLESLQQERERGARPGTDRAVEGLSPMAAVRQGSHIDQLKADPLQVRRAQRRLRLRSNRAGLRPNSWAGASG
jgi:hypothetical protein